jgi:uncharacterized protein (DUF58 family)
MAMVVCVDVSGTMSRGPLDEARKALSAFFTKARPDDRFALISFADEEELASSFVETRDHLGQVVRNLRRAATKHDFIKQSTHRWNTSVYEPGTDHQAQKHRSPQ